MTSISASGRLAFIDVHKTDNNAANYAADACGLILARPMARTRPTSSPNSSADCDRVSVGAADTTTTSPTSAPTGDADTPLSSPPAHAHKTNISRTVYNNLDTGKRCA